MAVVWPEELSLRPRGCSAAASDLLSTAKSDGVADGVQGASVETSEASADGVQLLMAVRGEGTGAGAPRVQSGDALDAAVGWIPRSVTRDEGDVYETGGLMRVRVGMQRLQRDGEGTKWVQAGDWGLVRRLGGELLEDGGDGVEAGGGSEGAEGMRAGGTKGEGVEVGRDGAAMEGGHRAAIRGGERVVVEEIHGGEPGRGEGAGGKTRRGMAGGGGGDGCRRARWWGAGGGGLGMGRNGGDGVRSLTAVTSCVAGSGDCGGARRSGAARRARAARIANQHLRPGTWRARLRRRARACRALFLGAARAPGRRRVYAARRGCSRGEAARTARARAARCVARAPPRRPPPRLTARCRAPATRAALYVLLRSHSVLARAARGSAARLTAVFAARPPPPRAIFMETFNAPALFAKSLFLTVSRARRFRRCNRAALLTCTHARSVAVASLSDLRQTVRGYPAPAFTPLPAA
ncbi:hypothetical protein FGB62_4g039 [Gracilaria domingensis]|nr:hypothetical protein FGB62_4g039 [Gracilaria domingensis]